MNISPLLEVKQILCKNKKLILRLPFLTFNLNHFPIFVISCDILLTFYKAIKKIALIALI
jgi:hypothetical protein